MILRPPRSTRTDTLFPYTTLFRSDFATGVIEGSPIAITSPVSSDLTGTVDFNVVAGSADVAIGYGTVGQVGRTSRALADLGSGTWGADLDTTQLNQGPGVIDIWVSWSDPAGGGHTYRAELPVNVRNDVPIALGYEGNRHGGVHHGIGR